MRVDLLRPPRPLIRLPRLVQVPANRPAIQAAPSRHLTDADPGLATKGQAQRFERDGFRVDPNTRSSY